MVLNEIGIVSIASRSDESQSFLYVIQTNNVIIDRKIPSHQMLQRKLVVAKIKRIADKNNLDV